jgi:hypothetical protein
LESLLESIELHGSDTVTQDEARRNDLRLAGWFLFADLLVSGARTLAEVEPTPELHSSAGDSMWTNQGGQTPVDSDTATGAAHGERACGLDAMFEGPRGHVEQRPTRQTEPELLPGDASSTCVVRDRREIK